MRLAAVVTVLAACGNTGPEPLAWHLGVATFDARALGLTAETGPSGLAATHPLALATYDGSGQETHPDVLREADRYVLAFTPYPYSDDSFENPSIAVGDGVTFSEPAPGENPLVPAPPIDHNNDPDLHVDPATGEYVLLYLETERPDAQTLVELRSADLLTWARRDAITYDLAGGAPFVVSPAAVVHGGATALFDVSVGGPYTLERQDEPWGPSNARPVSIDLGGVTPWHVDVVTAPLGYAMLISGYTDEFTRQSVYLATSADLATWTLRPEPLLAPDDLGVASLYRSTGAVVNGELVVWYAYED